MSKADMMVIVGIVAYLCIWIIILTVLLKGCGG